MKTVLKYLGGNKIGYCLIMFVAVSVLLAFKWLGSEQWLDAVKFLTVVAVGGNIAAQTLHVIDGKKKP